MLFADWNAKEMSRENNIIALRSKKKTIGYPNLVFVCDRYIYTYIYIYILAKQEKSNSIFGSGSFLFPPIFRRIHRVRLSHYHPLPRSLIRPSEIDSTSYSNTSEIEQKRCRALVTLFCPSPPPSSSSSPFPPLAILPLRKDKTISGADPFP